MSRMPKPSPARPRVLRPIIIGVAFLAVAAVVMVAIAKGASDPKSGIQVQLGDNEFRVGSVDRFSAEIAKNGPLLFAGLVGTAEQRPIGLFHAGSDPATGWRAFSITPPGAPAGCVLRVDRVTHQLIDPCTGRSYPPDGDSLPSYPTRIDSNRVLYVDLRSPSASSTTTPTTSRS